MNARTTAGLTVVTALVVLTALLVVATPISPAQGRFAEFDAENAKCLKCHDTVLSGETLAPGIKEAHRRHVESTVPAFGGRQRLCVTCHEGFVRAGQVPGLTGATVKGFFHPSTSNQPVEYWRLRPLKVETSDHPSSVWPPAPEDPQIFKPTLRRMVCVDCHAEPLKTLYPAKSP